MRRGPAAVWLLMTSACGAHAAADAGGVDGDAIDARSADARVIDAAAVDAAPAVHVTWSFTKDEVPATCAEVGAELVRVSWGPDPGVSPVVAFPCALGGGVVDPVQFVYTRVTAVDAAGNSFVHLTVPQVPGETELAVVLEVFTEPAPQLAAMAASAKAYYEMNGAFSPSAGTTPALGSCCASTGQVCAPNPTLWEMEVWLGWPPLGFSVTSRSRVMYTFLSSTGTSFTARAQRDLNCDSWYSGFEITGTLDAMGIVQIGPLVVTSEYE